MSINTHYLSALWYAYGWFDAHEASTDRVTDFATQYAARAARMEYWMPSVQDAFKEWIKQ